MYITSVSPYSRVSALTAVRFNYFIREQKPFSSQSGTIELNYIDQSQVLKNEVQFIQNQFNSMSFN